jgi:RimJ/RimL family protein N-acetyltransferase
VQPLGAPVPDWTPPPRPPLEGLEGRFVSLEPLCAVEHAMELHAAYAGNDALWTYMPYGPFADEAAYAGWIDETVASDAHQFHAIRPKASQKAEGVASYLRIDPAQGSIEVGNLCFSPRLSGTVAATEAMVLMMARAFELGYRRYEWKCNALNLPSRRAAQRLGFSFEGVFRQATVVKGRNRDTAWFSVIDAEWPALRDAFGRWLDACSRDADGRQGERLSDLTAPLLATRDPALL